MVKYCAKINNANIYKVDNPELKDYYRRRIERLEADRKAREVTTEKRCCCDCESVEAA